MRWEVADEKTKEYIISQELDVTNSKIKTTAGLFVFFGIITLFFLLMMLSAEMSDYEMSVSAYRPVYDYGTSQRVIQKEQKAREEKQQLLVDAMREELAVKYIVIGIFIELGIIGLALICTVKIKKEYKGFCANRIDICYGTCVGKVRIYGYRGINSRMKLTIQSETGRAVDMLVVPHIFHMIENGDKVIIASSLNIKKDKVFLAPDS